MKPTAASIYWTIGPPWWLAIALAVLTGLIAILTTRYQVRQAHDSAERRLFAEDARADRTTVAELVRGAREFSATQLAMYESMNDIRALRQSEEEPALPVARASAAYDTFRGVLDESRVRLGTNQLQTAAAILDREAELLVHKLGTYLNGTGFRLPLPGSTELLFAGIDDAIANLTNFAQIIRNE